MNSKKISIIGLGKLGAPYGAFYADAGFDVVGVDINKTVVNALNKGVAPHKEPRLQDYIDKNKARISATTSIEEATLTTNASLIVVATPSKKDGSFSIEYVLSACEAIGKALKKKEGYHLISLISTVLPGDSRNHIIPALEKASGKTCGVDFGYTYNPSLIAIGDILRNLEHPDFLFLGAFDTQSEEAMAAIYRARYPEKFPEVMSIESVEVAKIALNSYITTKITFANTLGQLCEHMPHADVQDVVRAIGKDARIGSKYLNSGLGYGGPCFPRDNAAFAQAASRYGVELPLAKVVHETNKKLPRYFVGMIEKILKKAPGKHIGFLGISYKPRTTMSEESQAFTIAQMLSDKKYPLTVYEPLGIEEAKQKLTKRVSFSKTLENIVKTSDLIFISNFDTHFETLPELVNKKKKPTIVFDPWNMFTKDDFEPHVTYKGVGRN